MRHPKAGCLGLLLICMLSACAPQPPAAQRIMVFAAASLTDAVEALADSFETRHPDIDVVVSVGASSMLARQIALGAPAELLLSAHTDWVAYLAEQRLTEAEAIAPFTTRLELISAVPEVGPEALRNWPRASRLGLADPAQVPVGLYAREALTCMGVWDHLSSAIVPTLNVRATVLTVRQQAAEAGIVYRSDVHQEADLIVPNAFPDVCQPSIVYAFALLGRPEQPATAQAQAFFAFLGAAEQVPVWEHFGFQPTASTAS